MPTRSRIATFASAAAPWFAIPTVAALLLRFPPDRYPFYPRCPVYTLFHLQCPGCGATRALAALLHGHLREAFHLNPLTTLLIPIALLYIAYQSRQPKRQQPPGYAIYSLLAISAIFTIIRNLP
nr:DUF2752 domain-containing protein [Granulicella sp. dw_53]